ncbi:50S ribosomal protein L4, partial [Verrucomicrobia bacterium]|nr:50S ribosomal protein L4 [Verrucomicrobiota bacterium]
RGGGVAHGPKPRVYIKKINKKVRDLAVLKSFTERVKGGEVIILDGLNIEKPATKDLVNTLSSIGVDSKNRGKGKSRNGTR